MEGDVLSTEILFITVGRSPESAPRTVGVAEDRTFEAARTVIGGSCCVEVTVLAVEEERVDS